MGFICLVDETVFAVRGRVVNLWVSFVCSSLNMISVEVFRQLSEGMSVGRINLILFGQAR